MIHTGDIHLAPDNADVVFAALKQMADDELSGNKSPGVVVVNGDVWKHRGYVLHTRLVNRFLDFIDSEPHIFWWFVVGNHDQIELSGTHALEFLRHCKNVRIFEDVETAMWGNKKFLMVPYRADRAAYNGKFEPADFCFVHHGVVGAIMNDGKLASEVEGLPPSWFASFKWTFASHWHRHHIVKGTNIVYAGSPWQVTSAEKGQLKGWLVVDPFAEGGTWEFRMWEGGPRFVEDGSGEKLRPGDTFIVDTAKLAPEALTQLQHQGVLIRPSQGPQMMATLRLGVPKEASQRECALAYAQIVATQKGLSVDEVMKTYDEIVGAV
jgi:hypothetical protein